MGGMGGGMPAAPNNYAAQMQLAQQVGCVLADTAWPAPLADYLHTTTCPA
jgi:hypothetical protein